VVIKALKNHSRQERSKGATIRKSGVNRRAIHDLAAFADGSLFWGKWGIDFLGRLGAIIWKIERGWAREVLIACVMNQTKKPQTGKFRLKKPVKIQYAPEELVAINAEEFVRQRAELIWRLSKN
jgi:hypothetical protein